MDGSKLYVYHCEELPNGFPRHLHHIAFPPAVWKGSTFSTSPARVIFHFTDYGYGSRYEAVSLYGFDSHFPNG